MTLDNFDYNLAQAYALGYYHGRAVGTKNDPYVSDDLRFLYSEGYQRGVTDYKRAFCAACGRTLYEKKGEKGGIE